MALEEQLVDKLLEKIIKFLLQSLALEGYVVVHL